MSEISITLRKNLSEANRVTKEFAAQTDKTYTGYFKETQNLLEPRFTIETTDDLTAYNYAEIAAFGRKYFANITAVGYKLYEIACSVDVLSTYATGIKASKALVKRTAKEGKIDFYVNDGSLFTEQREVVTRHYFKNSGVIATLGNESYYLLVAGG